ncbi:inactive pancreatic lipase-related protein 1-like [Ixodes scapularis]|uniref:inactive pancreatic lipase-related protein 1-like n=1 Tax=Ixodes scapularis TaxID=6945 RepID=UPI001A9DF627|nr:inactive pancreatic lipase-related protein 1-like [Ixodes scapularis]
MGRSLPFVVLATVTLGQLSLAPAVTDGGTSCYERNSFSRSKMKNGVQRRPFGSFDTNGNWAYLVPRESDEVNVTFKIFLEPLQAPIDYRPASDAKIPSALLSRNFTIVCHGLPRRLAADADILVRALLQHQDRNVLEILWNVVDCQLNGSDFYYCPENAKSSDSRWYQEAASDARLVARAVARMLNGFVNNYDYDLTRVHFIGFGLGAHVGGFVADELGYTGNVLGRLTALDAASPIFESRGLSRLSPSNALRVEAVHTGGAKPCGLGMAGPLGTLDIYVNGGERQPHCKSDRMCSHLAALGYYAQSVERCLADAVSTPLPGYWTDITGIVNVRRSSLRCLRLSSSDSVTVGAVGTSKSVSIVAQWTLVVTLQTLLVTCWELAHIPALF